MNFAFSEEMNTFVIAKFRFYCCCSEEVRGKCYQGKVKENIYHEIVGRSRSVQFPFGLEKEFRFGFNCHGKLLVDFRQGSDMT